MNSDTTLISSRENDISIEYSNSNDSPIVLNTTPSLIPNQHSAEDRLECSSSNESPQLDGLSFEFLKDMSILSNKELVERIDTIASNDQEILRQLQNLNERFDAFLRTHEKSITRIESRCEKQERMCENILSLLEKLTQIGKSNAESTQQPCEANQLESSLPINERSTITEKSVMNDSNVQLSHSMNKKIERIRSMKNRKEPDIGQGCNELLAGTTDAMTSLLPPTISNDQPQNKEYQCDSFSVETTTETPLSTQQDPSIALLHPLQSNIQNKTDRYTIISDCYGQPPVLVLLGTNRPDRIELKIHVVSSSKNAYVQSIYRFVDERGHYKDFESRSISKSDSPQQIKLDNLRLRKRPYSELRDKRIFKLEKYPSGEIINLKIKKQKKLKKNIDLRRFNWFLSALEFVCTQTYFPVVSTDQVPRCSLEILNKQIQPSTTTFDLNQQCSVEFKIKIPELFHCTLASGYKWLEVSATSGVNRSSIHSFVTENAEGKNPIYFNINQHLLQLSIENIKQITSGFNNNEQGEEKLEEANGALTDETSIENPQAKLPTVFPNRFRLQLRLLHSEIPPDHSSKGFYEECGAAFTEEFVFQNMNENEANGNRGQKRTIEVIIDNNNEYPPTKRR